MLPTPSSTSQKNCTGLATRFHAGSVAVCREGSIVALHFGTPEGVVLVTMRERDFVRGARGPRDHHGHPFRTLEQLDEAKAREHEAAALPAPPPPPTYERSNLTEEQLAAYNRVLAIQIANGGKRNGAIRDACAREGIDRDKFNAWSAYQRRKISA